MWVLNQYSFSVYVSRIWTEVNFHLKLLIDLICVNVNSCWSWHQLNSKWVTLTYLIQNKSLLVYFWCHQCIQLKSIYLGENMSCSKVMYLIDVICYFMMHMTKDRNTPVFIVLRSLNCTYLNVCLWLRFVRDTNPSIALLNEFLL